MKKAREQTKQFATKKEIVKREEPPVEVDNKRIHFDQSNSSDTESDSSEASWSDCHSLLYTLFQIQ